ncbi:MAG: hypothetical protein JXB29_02510 [Sedimentisphaerales bacterium]|nr:hypothetical protein [Sedimentisphaerales bacterium]
MTDTFMNVIASEAKQSQPFEVPRLLRRGVYPECIEGLLAITAIDLAATDHQALAMGLYFLVLGV